MIFLLNKNICNSNENSEHNIIIRYINNENTGVKTL